MAQFLRCDSIETVIARLPQNLTVSAEKIPNFSNDRTPTIEVGTKIISVHNGGTYLYTVCAHKPVHSEVLAQPVQILRVSTRVYSGLRKAHVHTVGDLVRRTEKNLLGISYFGKTCLKQVKEALDRYGLKLAG